MIMKEKWYSVVLGAKGKLCRVSFIFYNWLLWYEHEWKIHDDYKIV